MDVTVSNKEDLKKALENRTPRIKVIGDLAKTMRKRAKVKKATKISSALMIIGGIIAIPFTGGTSAGVSAMGLTAMGLTVGTVSITASELAILCGFVLGMTGILSGAKISFSPDGGVVVEPRYK